MILLYQLIDPETLETRYIGQTSQTLARRLSNHLVAKRKTHTTRWLLGLRKRGLLPIIALIARAESPFEADKAEIALIAAYKGAGCRLTNHDEGGQCAGKIVSAETRERQSIAHQGKKQSREQVENHAAALRGRKRPPYSQEWRDNIAAAKRGKPSTFKGRHHTAEAKTKLAAAQQGSKHSSERTEKRVAAMRGRKQSPRHIAKRVAAIAATKLAKGTTGLGRKKSPEHAAKIAAALRGRKKSPEQIAKSVAAKGAARAKRELVDTITLQQAYLETLN